MFIRVNSPVLKIVIRLLLIPVIAGVRMKLSAWREKVTINWST